MTEEQSTASPFSFDLEGIDIGAIKEALGAIDVDETKSPPELVERPRRRRPGRPPGAKNKATIAREEREEAIEEQRAAGLSIDLPAVPLTKRDEKEVSKRLVNILTGVTGIGGLVKPYVPMTDEEAEAIAEPLASYLVRNEATQGVAREILENYDLLAMVLGMGAYTTRVYKDRKDELASQRPANTTATQRVSTVEEPTNGRQPHEGTSDQVSLPAVTRGGVIPFDV